jgi:hypothetical protein
MQIVAILGALVLAAVALLLLARRTATARRPSRDQEECCRNHPANARVLTAIQAFNEEHSIEATALLSALTRADVRHIESTIGQLEAPGTVLFPLLGDKLPEGCGCKVLSWPALVHPRTGVLFGIRLGTYLCLLRLAEPARQEALAAGAVWLRNPVPALAHFDPAQLGEGWVVPNRMHEAIDRYYREAYEQAGI